MATFRSKFDIGDRVVIDGDRSMVVTVVAVEFRYGPHVKVEVQWMYDGNSQSAWMDEFRLSEY